MIDIIVFGAGINGMFLLKTKAFKKNVNIIAVLDNNYENIGNSICSIPVFPPKAINKLTYDVIAVTSETNYNSIISQLLNYHVPINRIILSDGFANRSHFKSDAKQRLWESVFGRNVINESDILKNSHKKFDKESSFVYADIPIELIHVDMSINEDDYYKEFFEIIQKIFPSNIDCHIFLSSNIELLEYLIGHSEKYPTAYLKFFNQEFSPENLLKKRKDFVKHWDVKKFHDMAHTETPIVLTYQKKRGRFNIIDGTHRTSFLYIHHYRYVKAIIRYEEFMQYLNLERIPPLLSYLKENSILKVYPPILNPQFTAFNNSKSTAYRNEIMTLLKFLRSYSIASKSAIDLYCGNGYISRVLRRLGLQVLSLEKNINNITLSKMIGDVENTTLNVVNKCITQIAPNISFDIAILIADNVEQILENLNDNRYLRKLDTLTNDIFVCKLPKDNEIIINHILRNTLFASYQYLATVANQNHSSFVEIGVFSK